MKGLSEIEVNKIKDKLKYKVFCQGINGEKSYIAFLEVSNKISWQTKRITRGRLFGWVRYGGNFIREL